MPLCSTNLVKYLSPPHSYQPPQPPAPPPQQQQQGEEEEEKEEIPMEIHGFYILVGPFYLVPLLGNGKSSLRLIINRTTTNSIGARTRTIRE